MKRSVSIMQPAYLPWAGFFELIWSSNVFVLLDDAQFSVQNREQRNRLFVNPGQVDWYSVPIDRKASFKRPIREAAILEGGNWRRKMWERIRLNYGKAPYFPPLAGWLERWFLTSHGSLLDQNVAFIRWVCELFGWERELPLSSAHPSELRRSERVLELLRAHGATRYLAANGSIGYMLEDGVFPVDNIEVLFQDHQPRAYPMIGASGFVDRLSVLDALLNVGPATAAALVQSGTARWLTWEERKSRHVQEAASP
ncbi:MAG: WbqC family protein [Planctomycetes bacterium]|nr:WbqC family protein [Planctomycetota bacterium]